MDLCTPTDQQHGLILVNNLVETTPLPYRKEISPEILQNLERKNDTAWVFFKDFVRGFKDPRKR